MIIGRINGGRQVAAPRFCGAILALSCLVAATACRRVENTAPGVTVKEEITPRPAKVGSATVLIELADSSQKAVSRAAIMVEADMSHPGMRPVFAKAKETAPGSYRGTIEFSMGGDWVLLLHIKLADGRRIERQMDVRGVRSN